MAATRGETSGGRRPLTLLWPLWTTAAPTPTPQTLVGPLCRAVLCLLGSLRGAMLCRAAWVLLCWAGCASGVGVPGQEVRQRQARRQPSGAWHATPGSGECATRGGSQQQPG